MRRSVLEYEISQTLGDHISDYPIRDIADEIQREYPDIESIDEIPGHEYWNMIVKHGNTRESK